MKVGLEKGELATYINCEDPTLVREEMEQEWGNSFQAWENRKQIEVISSDSVFPRGFEIEPTLSSLAETYQRTIAGKFIGWRLVDITFYPQEEKHLSRLVTCDKKYNTLGMGATTLCMYESPKAYEFEPFTDLLLCHALVVSQKLKILHTSEKFLRIAIDSVFKELFGEVGSRGVMAQIAKVVKVKSADELLGRLQQEPDLLRRGLSILLGESSYAVCRLVKEKLAEITVDTIM